VIDDDVSYTRLLKLNLEQTGQYAVRVENGAAGAQRAAHEFKPDLIFLDVMMPGRDGGDLAARFQADPHLQHVPIVFITGAVMEKEIRSHGGRIGGFTYLAKPVDLNKVLECIQQHLRR